MSLSVNVLLVFKLGEPNLNPSPIRFGLVNSGSLDEFKDVESKAQCSSGAKQEQRVKTTLYAFFLTTYKPPYYNISQQSSHHTSHVHCSSLNFLNMAPSCGQNKKQMAKPSKEFDLSKSKNELALPLLSV